MRETLLRAARKALPCYQWFLRDGRVVRVNGTRKLNCIHFDIDRYWPDLQIALERDGWTFNMARLSKEKYIFIASNPGKLINADTKPELLLKCIESSDE